MFESRVNSYFSFCLKSSTQQAQIRTHLAEEMRSKLRKSGNEELNENSVIPSYAVGCRRPTPGVGYVESITSPNVSLIVGHIEKATKTGFVDNKLREHEADILPRVLTRVIVHPSQSTGSTVRICRSNGKIRLQHTWHLQCRICLTTFCSTDRTTRSVVARSSALSVKSPGPLHCAPNSNAPYANA
jgi:hypothetical protein